MRLLYFSVFKCPLKMWNCLQPEHSALTPGNVQILLLCRSERRRCYVTSFEGVLEPVLELLGVGAGGSLIPFSCLMHQMCWTSCTCLDTQGVGFRFGLPVSFPLSPFSLLFSNSLGFLPLCSKSSGIAWFMPSWSSEASLIAVFDSFFGLWKPQESPRFMEFSDLDAITF